MPSPAQVPGNRLLPLPLETDLQFFLTSLSPPFKGLVNHALGQTLRGSVRGELQSAQSKTILSTHSAGKSKINFVSTGTWPRGRCAARCETWPGPNKYEGRRRSVAT